MQRVDQGRASKHIRLGWSDQIKENQIREDSVDKI